MSVASCNWILSILNYYNDPPIRRHIRNRAEIRLPRECINHHIVFSFHILNIKIIGLKFTYPFMLPIIQILLIEEELMGTSLSRQYINMSVHKWGIKKAQNLRQYIDV